MITNNEYEITTVTGQTFKGLLIEILEPLKMIRIEDEAFNDAVFIPISSIDSMTLIKVEKQDCIQNG